MSSLTCGSTHDSRRFPRIHYEAQVRLACLRPDLDPETGEKSFKLLPARSLDVGAGGLSVRAIDGLTPGRRVQVNLDWRDEEMLEAVGRIVWLEPRERPDVGSMSRMGIAFDEPLDPQRLRVLPRLARAL